MEPEVASALRRGGLIDITTRGRRTGEPRRIELVFFDFDGRLYISGRPGRRGWYANLQADPRFTFHLKRGVKADLPARARPVTDPDERRAVMTRIAQAWRTDPEPMIAGSPLVEVTIEDGR